MSVSLSQCSVFTAPSVIFSGELRDERAASMGYTNTKEQMHRALTLDEDTARESGTHGDLLVNYFTTL